MRLLGAFLLSIFLACAAQAQSGVGQLPALNVVGNPTGSAAPPTAFPIFSTANSWSALQTFSAGGAFGNANSANFGPTFSALWAAGTYTGTGTGPYAEFSITDTATNTTPGTALVGLRVDHSFSGNPGARTAIQSILNVTGATALSGGNPDLFKFYSSVFGQTYGKSNDGGVLGTPHGLLYGVNGLAQLQCPVSPQCYWKQIVGGEYDVSVQVNSLVAYKSAMSLISVNSDAVQGSTFDGALVFTSDGTGPARWTYGISFGRPDSQWPFCNTAGIGSGCSVGSTLIGAVTPGSGSLVAAFGIDFQNIIFDTCAFRSSGFCAAQQGSLQLSGSAAGIALAPRSGSGETLQWFNPSGTGLNLFNGTRVIATFDVTNDGSLAIVGPVKGAGIYATADGGGIASTNGISNVNSSTISTGAGSIKMSTANPATNTSWLKAYCGTAICWIPAFVTNAP